MTGSRVDYSGPAVDADQPTLVSNILKRRKAVVAGIAFLVALATAAFAAHQAKLYAATATVAVSSPLNEAAANAPNMANEQQTAQSPAVAERVRRQLNLRIPASTLLSHLSVGVPVSAEDLTFTYSDANPSNAQIRANAFANAYLAVRQEQLQTQFRQSQAMAAETSLHGQIPYLAQQMQALQAEVTSAGQPSALVQPVNALASNISQLRSQLSALDSAAAAVSGGSLIGPALLPGAPSSPLVSYTVIGFILGLMLGFGVAAVLEQFDDRLRNPADVRAGLGAPVLGVIPSVEDTAAPSRPRVFARVGGRRR